MQMREFGSTGEMVSVLGFGCMRFQVLGGDMGKIDEPLAIKQLRHSIDNGVNYIDTAWPYHQGASEILVGKALKDGYRERVKLATKMPSWAIEKPQDMDDYLEKQLAKLQSSYIDYYLVHALDSANWSRVQKHGVLAFLDRAKADGRIRFAGFSFHDGLTLFKQIVDAYAWDFVQVQYNYMDEDFQAGREGLEYAAARGMGVVVMEPLRGGSLVKNVPPAIQAIWDSAPVKRSPAEWALRYIWNHPGVSTVLSGMNTFEQIDENITAAEIALPGAMSREELDTIARVKQAYQEYIRVACTSCGYCMPCPFGVDIPNSFRHFNGGAMFDEMKRAKNHYEMWVDPEARAGNCTQCGECETKCPQQLEIREGLKMVAEAFGS